MSSLNERFKLFRERLKQLEKASNLASSSSESESDLEEPFKNYNDTIAIAKLRNCNQKLVDKKCEQNLLIEEQKRDDTGVSDTTALTTNITLMNIHHARYANFLTGRNLAAPSKHINMASVSTIASKDENQCHSLLSTSHLLTPSRTKTNGGSNTSDLSSNSCVQHQHNESRTCPLSLGSGACLNRTVDNSTVRSISDVSLNKSHARQRDDISPIKTSFITLNSGASVSASITKPVLADSGRGSSVHSCMCNNVEVNTSSNLINTSAALQRRNVLRVNNKEYQILNMIAKGGSCVVHQVYSEDNQRCYALKCVDLMDADEVVVRSYKNEVLLLGKLQLTNRVVRIFDYEYSKSERTLFVLMEKGDADLSDVFKTRVEKTFSDLTIAFYWSEMLKAVQCVHHEGIVHSDLKPRNFLLVGGHLKLIDFGIANSVPTNKTSVTKDCQMGTPNYMSPEALLNCGDLEKVKFKVGVKSDVWSLGCILYNMVYGVTPFQHIPDQYKYVAITNPSYKIEFRPINNALLLSVLQRCLERDTKKRASVQELLDHPYLAREKLSLLSQKSLDNLPENVHKNDLKLKGKYLQKSGLDLQLKK